MKSTAEKEHRTSDAIAAVFVLVYVYILNIPADVSQDVKKKENERENKTGCQIR